MDLIPVLYEAEARYGYMSDEAISVFQKVLKRAEAKRGTVDPYEEVATKNIPIERMPLKQQQEIIEMYTLGYLQREVGDYFGASRQSVNHYWRKMIKIGRLKPLGRFERSERHRELFKTMYRGKFNDVELIRRTNGTNE